MADTATRSCATCSKAGSEAPNLKICAKCKSTLYCSRECQKADWKSHKKVCSQQAAGGSSNMPNVEHSTNYAAPRLRGLDNHVTKPFTALDNGSYLHNRSETDVYKLLIDCFRMRQADDFKFEGKRDPNSVYSGAADSLEGFRKFIRLAKSRNNVLPLWWNDDKQKACEEFGMGNYWSSLKRETTKEEVQAQYGDERMPMQFRMLGEFVYGTGPQGQPVGPMRTVMMQMESGGAGLNGQVISMLSVK
ncbi:hypothetical protein BDV96DRAFT_486694 [Lophiotrema nucula]|uniref:MYND-type domain-containing protein n=1 Tax=Lophiotrema nucula TaxID=690887 RepID=A0A6A5ZLB3_9PLEO|nr:hypothetical protein BDV96DRAFT_486694 [Lophiotrema nucula]